MRAAAEALLLPFADHWTALHAAANAIGIALAAALIAARESWRVVAHVIGLAWLVQAVTLVATGAGEYRGASGLLYALAAYAFARAVRASGWDLQSTAIAIAAVAYVGAQAGGIVASPVLPEGVAVAWPMHGAGLASGAMLGMSGGAGAARLIRRSRPSGCCGPCRPPWRGTSRGRRCA